VRDSSDSIDDLKTTARDELEASAPPAASRPHSYGIPVSAPARTPRSQFVRGGRSDSPNETLAVARTRSLRQSRGDRVSPVARESNRPSAWLARYDQDPTWVESWTGQILAVLAWCAASPSLRVRLGAP